jgi:hypothetical protein
LTSPPATVTFRTSPEEQPPDPDDPSDPVQAPKGLYVEAPAPGRVEASWSPSTQPDAWWLASVDGHSWQRTAVPRIEWADVPDGQQRTVQVYALINGVDGNPSRLSKIVSAGVVTARKGESA